MSNIAYAGQVCLGVEPAHCFGASTSCCVPVVRSTRSPFGMGFALKSYGGGTLKRGLQALL